jgi:hypothetical protein
MTEYYDACIEGLLVLYAIVPVPLLLFIERYFFKTHNITLVRGYILWFATNVAAMFLFRVFIHFFGILGIYCGDILTILLFAVMLFCVSPAALILIFKKSFSYGYAVKITFLQILIFLVFGSAIFSFREYVSYKDRYRNAVFADSDSNEKAKILKSFSNACKLKFPESTKLIYAQWIKGDVVAAAKLEIDREDLSIFESQFDKPLTNRPRKSFDSWGPWYLWKPLVAKNFKMWQKDYSDILLDLDNDSKIIVYVIYATI